ncbi:hypothetical protein T310_8617, partial [Rasamsonia emersonii CBS 393.64]
KPPPRPSGNYLTKPARFHKIGRLWRSDGMDPSMIDTSGSLNRSIIAVNRSNNGRLPTFGTDGQEPPATRHYGRLPREWSRRRPSLTGKARRVAYYRATVRGLNATILPGRF